MKTTICLWAIWGGLCIARAGDALPNALQIPTSSGTLLDAKLEIIDSSQKHWITLPVNVQAKDGGFDATCAIPPDAKMQIHGTFEKSANSVLCAVKWDGGTELPEGFMMIVFRFPIEQFRDGVITELGTENVREISMARILEGGEGPKRTSLDKITAFSMGPLGGKTIVFTSASGQTPLAVEAIKTETDFQIRFLLTPRKSPLPASGSVAWTMEEK